MYTGIRVRKSQYQLSFYTVCASHDFLPLIRSQALCDYRNVDSSALSPPWCLTVTATGHTFAPMSETFRPRVTFEPKSVVFPAAIPGRPVHRTVVWRNDGDTPVLFDLSKDTKGYACIHGKNVPSVG